MTRRRSDAAIFADAFVMEFGTTCGRDLESIAAGMGAKVVAIESANYDGLLVRIEGTNRARIGINQQIPVEGRKRFTVAHELGHYVLNHGGETVRCRPNDIENWNPKLRREERDANTFAAEVLMPHQVVRRIVAKTPAFDRVEEIAQQCGTSLTSSALRLVELSSFQTGVVWSEAGAVSWYRTSPELRRAIRTGLDKETVAAACFASGRTVQDGGAEVPASAWMYEEGLRDNATLIEWSRAMPRYDGVLTLLYAPDFLDARTGYEEDDEQELDPEDFTMRRQRWPR
jgi:Zn-dependent peptidase ImmA (M78 family)